MSSTKAYLKAMGYYLSLVQYFNDAVPKEENLKESDLYDIVISKSFKEEASVADKETIGNYISRISKHFGMIADVDVDFDNIHVDFRLRDKLKEKEMKKVLAKN